MLLFSANSDAGQAIANLSTGYEKITSPLVRIDDNAPLILVEGRSKLEGQYYQFNLSGFQNWDLSNDLSFNLSGNVNIKQSPTAKDLNFSMASTDVTFRKKMDNFSVGIGSSLQRIWIANAAFRDSVALQADITKEYTNGSFTSMYLLASKSYFVDEFDFLGNKAALVSFAHHNTDIGFGLSSLDVQLNASRNKNIREAEDLSNYSYYGRVSLDKKIGQFTWSAGASIVRSYFDVPFLDGFAKRNDSYVSYEFGVEREFSDKLKMSLDLNKAKNYSNLVLFESDYRSLNLSLNYTF